MQCDVLMDFLVKSAFVVWIEVGYCKFSIFGTSFMWVSHDLVVDKFISRFSQKNNKLIDINNLFILK